MDLISSNNSSVHSFHAGPTVSVYNYVKEIFIITGYIIGGRMHKFLRSSYVQLGGKLSL